MSAVLKPISRRTVRASSVTIRGGVGVSVFKAKNRSRAWTSVVFPVHCAPTI